MVEQQLLSLHISCVSSTVAQTRINHATMNAIKRTLVHLVQWSGIQGFCRGAGTVWILQNPGSKLSYPDGVSRGIPEAEGST